MSETLKPTNCLYCGSTRIITGTCRKCGADYGRKKPIKKKENHFSLSTGEIDRLRRRDGSWKDDLKKKGRLKNAKRVGGPSL